MPAPREPMFGLHLAALKDLPMRDLVVRFAFGAAISTAVGVVSVLAGSEPAGILLAFPAILPATLTLVEQEEGRRQAEDLDVGAVLGAAALAAFAAVVWQYMAGGSAPLVLAAATAAWLGAAVVLYLGLRLVLARHHPLHRSIAEARSSPDPT